MMWTNDRYQTSIYGGFLGVWTTIVSPGNVVEGPFCVEAMDFYTAGVDRSETYLAGAVRAQGEC